jgi:isochorismate synthase
VAGAAAPSHYEDAVRRAVERIARGEVEKVVLAREVRVQTGRVIDPAPILDALRAGFPDCYCYCVGGPGGTFVGASPELLVRREGARAQTVALAGTTRRSADPAVDDHLGEQLLQSAKNRGEQKIVARRIERTLDPVSVWVAAAGEPVLIKVLNVQHLATPIRAQLADPVPAVELAGRLHPTPAVGGEPRAAAEAMIPALEGLDRGWYAGAVGWTDLSEDGAPCCEVMWPTSTRAAGSWRTPCPPTSWQRPSSSSGRCFPSWPRYARERPPRARRARGARGRSGP